MVLGVGFEDRQGRGVEAGVNKEDLIGASERRPDEGEVGCVQGA